MKILKIAALVLLVPAVLLGGAGAYLFMTFDANRIGQEIAVAVQKQTGRTLRMEQVPTLVFWPDLGLGLGRVSLSESGQAREFARIEGATVAVALFPLITQTVQVRELTVTGLTATVVKQKDGRLNIADLLGAKKPATPPEAAALPMPSFEGATLRLTDARLDWRDEQTGQSVSLSDLDLSIDRLDLSQRPPPAPEADPKASKTAVPGRIDLSALRGLVLKGTASIGQVRTHQIQMDDVRLGIAVDQDRLDIAPFSASLYGGRTEGNFWAEAQGNRFGAKQNLTGVSIGPLLKDLTGQSKLKGRGSVTLDIATSGDTVPALSKSLSGTAKIALTDGAISGIDIARTLRDAQRLIRGGPGAGVTGDNAPKTDFTEMTASFAIAGGVARNDDLSAKSPLLRLSGAGDIDIGNRRIDYLLKTSLVATTEGQGGQDIGQLRALTLPVRLTGPLQKPAWKIEWTEISGQATQSKVRQAGETVKQKAGDAIKGFLGRPAGN